MRLRAEYRVGPELKFLANLDMLHLLERALRRAGLPFALSEGFNPHVRLSMGTVLPVGLWGEREYFDLELTRPVAGEEFMSLLNAALPPPMQVKQCLELESGAPSLMKAVNAASYVFTSRAQREPLLRLAEELLNTPQLVVNSRGKKKDVPKDLRPGLHKIAVNGCHDFAIMEMWVSTGDTLNIRYDELTSLLEAKGWPAGTLVDIFRSGNYVRVGERFLTPLEKVR